MNDESLKSKLPDDDVVKPKNADNNNNRRRGKAPAAAAPFYRYSFQHFRPASFPVRRWAPAAGADIFYGDDGGGYHPAQKRSQQFMERSAATTLRPQPQRRRKHLQSCNEYHLMGGGGDVFDQRCRRESRSITGSKENLADLVANSNSPVNKLKQEHKRRQRSSHSETIYHQNKDQEKSLNSDSDEEEECAKDQKRSILPLPEKRLQTLSGTVPLVGFSPKFGGASMCLSCMEFFDLPSETTKYVKHLLEDHKLVIEDIELIVDLKRYVEYWRKRLTNTTLEQLFPKIVPQPEDPRYGQVDEYFLLSATKNAEDMQIRQRLAMRRLEEVLACQQRERQDQTFFRSCLFCRYQAAGNRAKLIHHLYMIHHLNLGSPDNLVFVNEYLDILDRKLRKSVCIYCEVKFPNREALDTHMREKGHREVNPNNDYYDKFYVINYLELGKKWIEVLAEDFEDTMPTFMDSEEEEEEESWHEWQEDNIENEKEHLLCLLCERSSDNLEQLLTHMEADHGFDLKHEVKNLNLSFYERVKFVNYIRACCHEYKCFACGKDDLHSWAALSKHLSQKTTTPLQVQHASRLPDRKLWDKEEFLIPTFENDALLCRLDDLSDGDEDADDDDAAAKRRARRSLPPDPAILDNGPLSGDGAAAVIVAEDPVDVSQSILNDKDLRQSLNVMENF